MCLYVYINCVDLLNKRVQWSVTCCTHCIDVLIEFLWNFSRRKQIIQIKHLRCVSTYPTPSVS